jgi:putative spermidine/putrescine transport system permease protein
VWWLVFAVGVVYFFLPLIGALEFSLRACAPEHQPCTVPDFTAYARGFGDPGFAKGLIYAFTIGVVTIVASVGLILPTAYWVRLRVPRLRPVVEFITLVPFVVPAIVLAFGMTRIYGSRFLPLMSTELGSNVALVAAYTVLSFPYMFRSIDTGLAAIDIRSLTEASQSLGAGWPRIILRVILPNLRTALLSGAFLTLAIVIGEYTIAFAFARGAMFGPYLSTLGQNRAFEPAALSLVSFGITWVAMIIIALVGRGSRTRIQIAGAR